MTKTPATRPASPSFVTTSDGAELFLRDWGGGPPILFCAAWAMSSEAWGYQMLPLGDAGYRCIAYDRRGHGRSSDPGGGYDFDTLADDLAAVIEALDLTEVTLVGHSMAGGEIVRYLSRHGSARISRVVLVAPITPCLKQLPDNPVGLPAAYFAQTVTEIAKDAPRWLEANSAGFLTPDTSPAMGEWVRRMMEAVSLKAFVDLRRIMGEADFRAECAAIDLPTLIIHGDADISAPIDLTGRPTHRLIKGSTLRVVPGAPHGFPLTHAEVLNAALTEFISADEPARQVKRA